MTGTEVDPWLTYQQAAQIVGVHKNTLRAAVRRKELEVSRISHTIVRIRLSAVNRWVEASHSRSVGRQAVGC
jgi:excisionase family DNA binding protein